MSFDDRNSSKNFETDSLNWSILFLSVLPIFGCLGNGLVCLSICFDKKLQTATNCYLFSLSIADFLVSSIVLPIFLIKEFQGSWRFSDSLCRFYIFVDVLLCTTSIWHLTVVSIDRFLSISSPFRFQHRTKSKIIFRIFNIWFFSVIFSLIPLGLGFFNENNIFLLQNENLRFCTLNNRSFIVFGSILCFFVPCAIMLISYALTFRRLKKQIQLCSAVRDQIDQQNFLRRHQNKFDKKNFVFVENHFNQRLVSRETSNANLSTISKDFNNEEKRR